MMQSIPDSDDPERNAVWRMFDRISRRYDLLNRLLSFGRDQAWRRALVRGIPSGADLCVVDLATGTADVLVAARDTGLSLRLGVGVDPSKGMIALGREKIQRLAASPPLHLVRGDACALPLAEAGADAITMAFGIRNVADVDAALREMRRLLRPGGRALILEFSLPENRLVQRVYLLYFRHVLPRIGGLISGDAAAYRYLNQSVEQFPYGAAFCAKMRAAGFVNVSARPMTFGVATVYAGASPDTTETRPGGGP